MTNFTESFLGSREVNIKYLPGDEFVTSAIVRHGLMPCAPYAPTTAITIRVPEVLRIHHLQSPHTSIQSWVKTLCTLQSMPFKPYLSRQFSIAFDLYLSILTFINEIVQTALNRDSPDWHLRHACPACTYILVGEEKLKFNMLYTIDGNDSLKRIVWQEIPPTSIGDSPILGESSKLTDTREAGKGVYLTCKQVDEWSKETLKYFHPTYDENDIEENPCAERWRNMRTELTAKMWGIFEETGLFLALCHHGFVLLLVDMVCSGELYVPFTAFYNNY
jgi:Kyakuja-Dileera-Zisupton transposase